jgi:hypothetical protein
MIILTTEECFYSSPKGSYICCFYALEGTGLVFGIAEQCNFAKDRMNKTPIFEVDD